WRGLEAPDVRVRVEDVKVVQVPAEAAHVDLQFVRRLLQGDKQASLAALQAFPQELHREDRLSRARRARDDVWPPGVEAAVEHLIKTREAGPDLGRGRHPITCRGRGGAAAGADTRVCDGASR